jgi:hypothetical protein
VHIPMPYIFLFMAAGPRRVARPQMLSTMTISNSLAPSFLRCAAASRYSGDSWQATAFSRLGNSMTMKRWNFSGPSRILYLPPRARILPPNF